MLNRLKVISDDKGFVLKEIQEMKWRDTLQSTASKERRISKKMERYERGRTTTMRMGMKDMTYSRNYRANERKFQHGPILRGNCFVFVRQKVRGVLKICYRNTI
jgi:hypothetical protein